MQMLYGVAPVVRPAATLASLVAGVNGGSLYEGYNSGTRSSWLAGSWGTLSNTSAPGGEVISGLHWWAADGKTYLIIAGTGKTAWFAGRQIWINGTGYTCTNAVSLADATYADVSTAQLFTNGVSYTISFTAP